MGFPHADPQPLPHAVVRTRDHRPRRLLMMIRELVLTALRAAKNAADEKARYLIAFVYGIIALSGAIFFTLLFQPWLYIWVYIGLDDADGGDRYANRAAASPCRAAWRAGNRPSASTWPASRTAPYTRLANRQSQNRYELGRNACGALTRSGMMRAQESEMQRTRSAFRRLHKETPPVRRMSVIRDTVNRRRGRCTLHSAARYFSRSLGSVGKSRVDAI